MRKTPLRRKPWRKALGTPAQRLAFRLGVLAADNMTCVMERDRFAAIQIDGDLVKELSLGCEGPLQACHIISKRKLRELGHGADTIYSVDAAFTACERHHRRHDMGYERVPWERLPARCKQFVSRLGLSVLLERTYEEVRPPRKVRSGRWASEEEIREAEKP